MEVFFLTFQEVRSRECCGIGPRCDVRFTNKLITNRKKWDWMKIAAKIIVIRADPISALG